jgi:hypothetical protein
MYRARMRKVLFVALAACGNGNPPAAVPPVTTATATATQEAPVPPPVTTPPETTKKGPATFDDDVAFLRKHGDVIVLESTGGGRVALSAKYQGRVMTSAVAPDALSLGFVFRKFIEAGKSGTQFDNYGGEDRFWLGPEGGQFGLYFQPGKPFSFGEWQTPHAMQEGEWTVKESTRSRVVFTRSMKVTNWSGTELEVDVERTVQLIDASRLGAVPEGVKWIGFETVNKITNAGKKAWTKDKGLLSVWILAMYNPSPDTYVAIPIEPKGTINDAYFGKVPADRLKVYDNYLLFKCDGDHRGKIGIPPAKAKEWAGSYSASSKLLTLVHFDKPKATDYVNSMWEQQKQPYAGDVVNSYNDGAPEPGKEKLGGFYEIETSSPAAALAPKASLVHTHRTFHLVGDLAALDPIAQKTLGVTATRISEGIK